MTVSIVAGPASAVLLRNLEPGVGVLASSPVLEASNESRRYELPPNSNPEQILTKIREVAAKGIEHLIICCEPERPPMAYASLFAAKDHEINQFARLTTTAFAIDAGAFLDLILGRTPEADGACFIAEQIEFVDQIFLGPSTADDADLAHSIAHALNPHAQVSTL